MSDHKSRALIICNRETMNPAAIYKVKMCLYRAGMKLCILCDKNSTEISAAVENMISKESDQMDAIVIIVLSRISYNRLFETTDGTLDLYNHFLYPIMNAEVRDNNKLCIMNGAYGKIERKDAKVPGKDLQLKSNGKNTTILISSAPDFLEDFISILFKCDGDVGRSKEQYEKHFPDNKLIQNTTNPKMKLNLVPKMD